MKPKPLLKNLEFEDYWDVVPESYIITDFKKFDQLNLMAKLDRIKTENSFLERENQMLRNEIKYLKETISDKMDEHSAHLEQIIKFQTQIPKIYYIGLPFGIIGLLLGILNDNLLYAIAGIGIGLTAVVGILELAYGTKIRRNT